MNRLLVFRVGSLTVSVVTARFVAESAAAGLARLRRDDPIWWLAELVRSRPTTAPVSPRGQLGIRWTGPVDVGLLYIWLDEYQQIQEGPL